MRSYTTALPSRRSPEAEPRGAGRACRRAPLHEQRRALARAVERGAHVGRELRQLLRRALAARLPARVAWMKDTRTSASPGATTENAARWRSSEDRHQRRRARAGRRSAEPSCGASEAGHLGRGARHEGVRKAVVRTEPLRLERGVRRLHHRGRAARVHLVAAEIGGEDRLVHEAGAPSTGPRAPGARSPARS